MTVGDQAIAFDLDGYFSRGEIRQSVVNGDLLVEFNTDSDVTAEMSILVTTRITQLSYSDFQL